MVRLAEEVRAGKLGARELVGHTLERIGALNPTINAFVAIDGERAMAAATEIDEAVALGRDPGPLAGIPLAVKDLEDAKGFVTTHGSVTRTGGAPVALDSPLVARLKAAGCVVVGKTNTPEFGWKADTDNTTFGRTVNPWNTDHIVGGSSGGSAAAIAAGMVPLATGSDGGGSIRIPSSCCGLSGIKPSLGRVPSGGPDAPDWLHLSTKGVMARRMADVVAALDVVVGPDPTDLRSLPRPEASWLAALDDPSLPVRVAWSPTLGYAPVDDEVLDACERAVETIAELGVDVIEVDSVFDHDPVDDWLTLTMVYNLRSLAEARGTPAWGSVDALLAAQVDYAADHITALDMVRAEDACHTLNTRPGRPLPRCAPLADSDVRGATATVCSRWCRHDQRHVGPELGAVHLPLQHDALAGGLGVRRPVIGRAPDRAPARRPPTRRSRRHPLGGCPRSGHRLRPGGPDPRLTKRCTDRAYGRTRTNPGQVGPGSFACVRSSAAARQ